MIKVDEVKQFIDSIANKDQSGNTYTPNEFNMWLRRSADDLFRQELGLPQDYKPGAPLPNIAYELTQRIKDDLRGFKEDPIIAVDANGKMVIPANYVHYTFITYIKVENQPEGDPIVTDVDVEVVDDNKFNLRKDHPIKGPDKDDPICNFGSTTIEFAPKDLYKVRFTYLRYPKKPEWTFTLVDDVEIFDPANSTDIELPEILTNDISRLILSYFAQKTRDEGLLAYAESIKAKGV